MSNFPNFKRQLSRLFGTFIGDRNGNIALLFALTLVPLLLAVGASVDFVRAYNVQDKMQADIDSAMLAVIGKVGKVSDDELKGEIVKWYNAQTNITGGYVLNTKDMTIDTANSTVQAKVTSQVNTTFMKLAGIQSIPIGASSTVAGGATESKAALSMYLVLDRSGSMASPTNTSYTYSCTSGKGKNKVTTTCTAYYTKIESLKLAVTSLLAKFIDADPTSTYVRTGAVSYNGSMQTPTNLAWGTTGVATYVAALTATSTTDSSLATQTAYESLIAGSENSAHMNKNQQVPEKYIVLMTDGENTTTTADTNTKKWCDKAKLAKIEIYTVAFMAPSRGQALLNYCATDSGHYFPAENTSDLVSAFNKIGVKASKKLVRLAK